jgi:8-oxo-dGTP diphosphatase/2-hydroxy-dATP diphosphatase
MNKLLTLCLVTEGGSVLLGMKKRGFGAGRWNGFGGKVEAGETIEAAAIREVKEEAGIDVWDIEEVGVLEFEFQGDPQIHEVHIFKTQGYSGNPVEGEEMKPQWFTFDSVPYKEMWPDDIFWLPKVFEGKRIKGKFLFAPGDIIIEQHLEEF